MYIGFQSSTSNHTNKTGCWGLIQIFSIFHISASIFLIPAQDDKINNKCRAMDPRPYHFDYRRPRLNNPTYQSLQLYQSIYQLDNTKKVNPEQTKNIGFGLAVEKPKQNIYKSERLTPQSEPESIKRHQSSDIVPASKLSSGRRYENRDTRDPRMQRNQSPKMNSSLSHYGSNLMNGDKMSGLMVDQNRIYQKQEKEFNIINYQPKGYTPRLRNYPKLTLEHQLIERRSLEKAM